jgi:hypothetical protein
MRRFSVRGASQLSKRSSQRLVPRLRRSVYFALLPRAYALDAKHCCSAGLKRHYSVDTSTSRLRVLSPARFCQDLMVPTLRRKAGATKPLPRRASSGRGTEIALPQIGCLVFVVTDSVSVTWRAEKKARRYVNLHRPLWLPSMLAARPAVSYVNCVVIYILWVRQPATDLAGAGIGVELAEGG